jgi:hypothetical protein
MSAAVSTRLAAAQIRAEAVAASTRPARTDHRHQPANTKGAGGSGEVRVEAVGAAVAPVPGLGPGLRVGLGRVAALHDCLPAIYQIH